MDWNKFQEENPTDKDNLSLDEQLKDDSILGWLSTFFFLVLIPFVIFIGKHLFSYFAQ